MLLKNLLSWIIARGKEPSTWAALAAMLAGLGITVPGELWGGIVHVGMGIAIVLGFALKEKGTNGS